MSDVLKKGGVTFYKPVKQPVEMDKFLRSVKYCWLKNFLSFCIKIWEYITAHETKQIYCLSNNDWIAGYDYLEKNKFLIPGKTRLAFSESGFNNGDQYVVFYYEHLMHKKTATVSKTLRLLEVQSHREQYLFFTGLPKKFVQQMENNK